MSTKSQKPSVKLVHGQATTTSLKVAEAFGKQHKAVLRAIENLECTQEFRQRNFAPAQYEVKTPTGGTASYKMFIITRKGFTFLACKFTGKEAAQWTEKFIEAFDDLERRALEKAAAKRLPKPKPQALPATEGIDVRRLLLEGQSDPSIPLTAEIHSAINRRAWTMAHEVYEILREHLARRVAYTSEMGSPRYLDAGRALKVIAGCDINNALAHTYYSGLHHCASMARSAKILSAEYLAEMEKALEGKSPP